MSAIGPGSVNTTWKYGTGSRSASRAASQSFAAAPWHFGQCRLRQELYEIRLCVHFSQRATCPPRAAVRQLSIADITLSWPRLTWPALARRHAGPWPRKMSATSSDGGDTSSLVSGGRFGALLELARNAIERAHDLPDGLGGDPRIERGGVELGVPQQDLDHPDIGVLLQKMGRKAVTKGVRGHRLADLGHLGRGIAGAPELARRHRVGPGSFRETASPAGVPPCTTRATAQADAATASRSGLCDPCPVRSGSPCACCRCRIPSARPPRTRAIRPHRPHSMPPCL